MGRDLDEIIPKTIKIGYSIYTIEIQDDKWMEENKAYGDQHGHKKVINICDGWELMEVLDTLNHEIFHAIWEFMNLPAKAAEEPAIHSLSSGWAMVWKDNPELRRFYLEAPDE